VLLVLPSVAQRRKSGVKLGHPVLDVGIEAVQLGSESPHLFRVHDGLGHKYEM